MRLEITLNSLSNKALDKFIFVSLQQIEMLENEIKMSNIKMDILQLEIQTALIEKQKRKVNKNVD